MLHDWSIEPHEYARHEARRGRRHAYAGLLPTETALVVIDMVPFFVDENPYARGIVPNVNRQAHAVRDGGGLVCWVVPARREPTETQREFFGDTVAAVYAASGGDGPPEGRVAPDLDRDRNDVVVEKSAPSALFPGRSRLGNVLAAHGIRNVIVAGTVANVCCEATARDASALGYRVVMVADANAATCDEHLNATLRTIYRSFGDVRTTAEVIELVTRAARSYAL